MNTSPRRVETSIIISEQMCECDSCVKVQLITDSLPRDSSVCTRRKRPLKCAKRIAKYIWSTRARAHARTGHTLLMRIGISDSQSLLSSASVYLPNSSRKSLKFALRRVLMSDGARQLNTKPLPTVLPVPPSPPLPSLVSGDFN